MENDLLKLGKVKTSRNVEKFLPLYANRGVSTPETINLPLFNICVDWVTVSFNYDFDSFKFLLKTMNIDVSSYVEIKGTFNIQYSYLRTYHEHIKVYLPDNYMTDKFARCTMELSGQACRLLELLNNGLEFWCPFFCMICSLGGSCSRCDLAIDDMKGEYFTIMDLFNKVMAGEYVCSSQLWNVVAKGTRDDETHSDTGFTIYLGSTSSERQLCIYNKKSERKVNGFETFIEYWVRYELRFKKDTANTLFHNHLINVDFWNNFASNVSELFMGFVEFKESMDEDSSHRNRSLIWKPWSDFLGTTSKIKIRNQAKLESTIAAKKTWYQENYSNFMNEIALSDLGGFNSYMENTLLDRLNKFDFDEKRLQRVNNYRFMSGQDKLTSREFFSYINNLRINNGLQELSDSDQDRWKSMLFPQELEV